MPPESAENGSVTVPLLSTLDVGFRQRLSMQLPPNIVALSSCATTPNCSGQVPRSPLIVNRTPEKARASTHPNSGTPKPTKALAGSVVVPGFSVTSSPCQVESLPNSGVTAGGARPVAWKV